MVLQKRRWLEDITQGITHEQAAEKACVNRTTYTKAVNGYPIGIKSAKKIAAAFGFDWKLFFDEICDESEHNDITA